ncbi:uncharacterized protein [Fopius arisanus]|uniref:Kinetochore protein SPC25 n=1 Tax=Fopius arisanus TaxID=64838 RepID=A0A9R1U3L9_9HYME|nr:PREDICTED: uncharacterized protein LOC105268962 [Fopius arisanus]
MLVENRFECDMETILSCSEEEKLYFKRLNKYLHDCRTKITKFVEVESNKGKGTSTRLEQDKELIAQLSTDIRTLETQLDNILLNQKISNKKLENTIATDETLNADICREKEIREALALETVDLQQQLETQKEAKKKEWNAIKMAIAIYKEKLNIHIDVQHQENHDTLTVTLVHDENPNRDNNYVVLQHSEGAWRVSNIQPPLSDKDLTAINLNQSRDYEILEITRFLCQIRNIFLKHDVSDK